MKKRRICTILLALSLALSACGERRDAGPAPLAGARAYTAELTPQELPVEEISAVCTSGGVLYIAGNVFDYASYAPGEEEDSSGGMLWSWSVNNGGDSSFSFGDNLRAVLYRLDPASGEITQLEGYVPEPGASITALVPGADGSLWVLEQTVGGLEDMESLSDNASIAAPSISGQVWRRLSAGGDQELERIDTAQAAEGGNFFRSLVDSAGRLYLASGNMVTVVDGGTRFTCGGQEEIEKLISLADGGVGALAVHPEGGYSVIPIDPEARSWGTPRPLAGDAGRFFDGDAAYEFLYSSGDSLYGWPKGGDGSQRLLSWSGIDIDCGQVRAMTFLPDGRGAALLEDGSGWPVEVSTALLSPVNPETLAERTVFTLATMGLSSETRTRVMEFNRRSGQYRIEIRDYSEFNTPEDASAGLTKLNTEILSGKMPDLLEVTGAMPLRQYAAKGYLEDLWPYVESDPELGREKVMERALQAAELDGKLVQVFPSFILRAFAGASAAVGEKSGWTLADLKAALERLGPDGCILDPRETGSSLFEGLFSQNLDRFVDWNRGSAHFDDPAFQEILEFCATFPAQPKAGDDGLDAMTRAVEGRQLLLSGAVFSLSSVKIYRELFNGSVTFVGCPDGQGVPARFAMESGLALSSACRDKEGAWSFLRSVLLPTGQTSFSEGFPINRTDFENMAEENMKLVYAKDENGDVLLGDDGEPIIEGQAYGFLGGRMVPLYPVTQADYDQAMELYNAAGSAALRDENLWTIVRECAGAYFAGDQTVEQAVGAIQNRVALYLNEQK